MRMMEVMPLLNFKFQMANEEEVTEDLPNDPIENKLIDDVEN